MNQQEHGLTLDRGREGHIREVPPRRLPFKYVQSYSCVIACMKETCHEFLQFVARVLPWLSCILEFNYNTDPMSLFLNPAPFRTGIASHWSLCEGMMTVESSQCHTSNMRFLIINTLFVPVPHWSLAGSLDIYSANVLHKKPCMLDFKKVLCHLLRWIFFYWHPVTIPCIK